MTNLLTIDFSQVESRVLASLSATERAAIIRAEFKREGIKASIRAKYFSMGSSVDITVTAGSVAKARQIAETLESIRRDESGEILSGGNCYVSVEPAQGLLTTILAAWKPEIAAAFADVTAVVTGQIRRIGTSPFGISWNGQRGELWELGDDAGHLKASTFFQVEHLEHRFACAIADRG
jgi:hypothetical protein